MPRIAHYVAIKDGPFDAPDDPDSTQGTFTFTVPPDVAGSGHAVLSFLVRSVGGDDTTPFWVKVNDTKVFSVNLSRAPWHNRMVQEVFSSSLLRTGDNANVITFTRSNALLAGVVSLSDVVVWFQQDLGSILFDGRNANIYAGGDGDDGDIVLRSARGEDRIRLDANSADIRLIRGDDDRKTPSQATIHLNGSSAEVRLGAHGTNGRLRLFPSHVVDTDPPAVNAAIQLEANNARLIVGGGGSGEVPASRDGEILVRGGNPEANRIFLRGDTATIQAGGGGSGGALLLRSYAGWDRILLNADYGQIVAGGHGVDGDVFLYPSDGSHQDLTQSTIHLNGEKAEAWLGRPGTGGALFLLPSTAAAWATAGEATIHLDGETGEITAALFTPGADCAEDFEIDDVASAEPGTVMVIGEQSRLRISDKAYDRCVAGVIAGAGVNRPGIVLGRGKGEPSRSRPVALVGRVLCKADASEAPIDVGDLLTTSPVAGHAMKVSDPARAVGAMIGKALGRLESGRGLVPILVALQ